MTYPTFVRPVLALAAIGLLAGCSEPLSVTSYSPSEQPSELQVTYTQLTQPLRFQPGSDRLAPGERERLIAFAQRRELTVGDNVQFASAPTSDALARRRAQAAVAALASGGVRFFNVSQTSDPALPRDSAEFRLDRHLVTLPRCPNWSSEPQNWSNRPSSNFGCANTTNLGLMIANPADLVGGRTLGPSDGTHEALGVRRYRSGNPTPLAASGTSDVQATGAGGQSTGATPTQTQ
jgi:pilus assembly protein CpaD